MLRLLASARDRLAGDGARHSPRGAFRHDGQGRGLQEASARPPAEGNWRLEEFFMLRSVAHSDRTREARSQLRIGPRRRVSASTNRRQARLCFGVNDKGPSP